MADDSNSTTQTQTLFLPNSVPDEFKDESFLNAIKCAKQTLGLMETGLSAKSEFELYFQTGPSKLDFNTLWKRAQNIDIRHSKIRSVYWKVFLGLISNDTALWQSTLETKRRKYEKLKDEYIKNAMKEEEDSNNLQMDNPLLSASGGKWDKFYKDTELKETIILDIDRTYPEDEFFVNGIVQQSLIDILFIFCKEHTKISYKQGMNEIIATLFMVNCIQSTISPYVEDDSKITNESELVETKENVSLWEHVQDIRYIEHDTYWMFVEIMSIMAQYFMNESNKEIPPVVERSQRIQGQFLRAMDSQLSQHLLKINLTPQLYGLRWIRLFFSREFHLRDVCVVWDAIFANYSERKQLKNNMKNSNKEKNVLSVTDPLKVIDAALANEANIKLDFRFVDYMSCSMLLFIRHQLIGRDISHCLRRVMRYPPIEDVAYLIERAYTIRNQIECRNKKIKGKSINSNNLNIADRWNQFSKTVSSAMNTYAEDVKNLMSGQRRTLKSRMQFEYALGTKMGKILETIQSKISEVSFVDTSKSGIDELLKECDEQKDEESSSKDEEQQEKEQKPENALLIIEESLAELKLVKDALLGNLEENELANWLNWKYVEPSPEPNVSSNHNNQQRKIKNNSHRRNLSSSGLPPPKKGPSHPLDF